MPAIFISYRRIDSKAYAGRLFDRLNQHFGANHVFMDIEGGIQRGEDFAYALQHAVDSVDAMIILIGRQWLTCTGHDGRRRLDHPDDWVHQETASALRRGILVLPVLVDGAIMPDEADLPENLRALARRQASEISDTRWGYDVSQIIAIVERQLRRPLWRRAPGRIVAAALAALAIAAGIGFSVWRSLEDAVATFAPSMALSKWSESELKSTLINYKSYLGRFGLAPRSVPIVHVLDKLPEDGYDAYYKDNEIYVRSSHANPAKVVHEFSHSVLFPKIKGNLDEQWEYSAIEAGVANYLTADFLGSAMLDSVDLNQRRSISATHHDWVGGQGEGGLAWGGFLWALRKEYSSEKATPAIVKAFRALQPSEPPRNYTEIFLKELTAAGLDWAKVTQP